MSKEKPKKIAGTDHHYMGRDYAEYENINCEWCGEGLPVAFDPDRSRYLCVCCEGEYGYFAGRFDPVELGLAEDTAPRAGGKE